MSSPDAPDLDALHALHALHRRVPQYLDCDYSNSKEHDVCPDGFESADGEWCCPSCTESDGGPTWVCSECFDQEGNPADWPCSTAELIYPKEEL